MTSETLQRAKQIEVTLNSLRGRTLSTNIPSNPFYFYEGTVVQVEICEKRWKEFKILALAEIISRIEELETELASL